MAFCNLNLVSFCTGAGRAGWLESNLTKGKLDSLIVSPPGNFNSNRALSLPCRGVRVAGLGAMGLYLTGFTEATGISALLDLVQNTVLFYSALIFSLCYQNGMIQKQG